MAKCTITFLFDTGQVFQESWELADGHGDPLPIRLKRVAQARLPLLAACVRIVQLKAQGHPLERVDLRGTGGAFAHPRYALKLTDDGYSTGIFLRGVPREVYANVPPHHRLPNRDHALRIYASCTNPAALLWHPPSSPPRP